MKERPIIFTGDEVRAIQAGRKTQFRRPIKTPGNEWRINKLLCDWALSSGPYQWDGEDKPWQWRGKQPPSVGDWMQDIQIAVDDYATVPLYCPFGVSGDRLWVKETWATRRDLPGLVMYRANHQEPADFPFGHIYDEDTQWRSPVHMPRKYSRLTLEIDVRVERLQDISDADVLAEGVQFCQNILRDPKLDRWVWVVEFKQP